MKKLDDVNITDEAVKFAGEYVSEKFKSGAGIQKHLVVNTVAHGYYMGAIERRRFNTGYNLWYRLMDKYFKKDENTWLNEESIKAANFYLKKKKFQRLNFAEQALIKASLCYGFQHGYRSQKEIIGA